MTRDRRQTGFTLTEMLIVVVIVAVALVWVMGIGKRAQGAMRQNEALALQAELAQAVGRMFAGSRNYGSDSDLVPMLENFGAIPGGARILRNGRVVIEHPYRGPVRVIGGPEGRTSYLISFRSLDPEICAALGTKLLGETGSRTGLWRIQINQQTVTTNTTRARAAEMCTGGDRANRVDWEYH